MNWARFHQAAIRSHGFLAMVSAVLLVGVMHLVSCTTDNGYLRYQSLRVAGWEYRDSVEFVVDSLPTSGTRQLSVALRKSSSHAYPYTSLTMAVHQTWRLGDSTLVNRIDTMECVFNKPDGMIRSKGVSLYPFEFSLGTVMLPTHATGRVVIRHLMNQQSVPGFESIGLRME